MRCPSSVLHCQIGKMTNDKLRVRHCTGFGREKSCGVHITRVWEDRVEMGVIRPKRRVVSGERCRISAEISRFGVQKSPCFRHFSPFFASARRRRRSREKLKDGAPKMVAPQTFHIQRATCKVQAQERKRTAGRFGPLKKARKYALARFGSVYSSAEFGVRNAGKFQDSSFQFQARKGQPSTFTAQGPTNADGGGRGCG